MDLIVTPLQEEPGWELVDLLGRSMGRISSEDAGFTIHPEGQARETMAGMKAGPFASLDTALSEIEKHTRGSCRRPPPGQDRA